MIRAEVWFRCAAMRDPVLPMLAAPAVIGWRGKGREINLTIEREFSGSELLKRMKGWITVDPRRAIQVIEQYGRLKCFDDGRLIVEVETEEELEALKGEIRTNFSDQCNLEIIPKK
jgi:hypothetical protein